MSEKKGLPLNYIYFGSYFFFLFLLHVSHILLIQPIDGNIQVVYLVFAFLQSFIEAFLLSYFFSALHIYRKIFFLVFFLALLTIVSFVRIADFATVRLMDVSAWRWIELVAQETFANFVEMLYASNVKIAVWLTGFVAVALAVVLSVVFFFLTQKICKHRCFVFSHRKITSFSLAGFVLLGALDISCYIAQVPESSFSYVKALPWKRTFSSSKEEKITVSGYLQTPPAMSLNSMDSTLFSLERKPDLFLFVVESLRQDYLTEETTPALTRFRKEHYSFENALSNANGTQKSWFSLFYSLYPFYWTKYAPKQWKQGGLPLSLLKKMGYQIHVYASSRLEYYSMDEELFGENRYLADQLYEFGSSERVSPADSDRLAVEKLCKDLQTMPQKGGRVFILFLDGTHFDYSWPEEKDLKFLPISSSVDYLEIIGKRRSVDIIKNRYKNALNAVDDLFQVFQKTLVELQMWKDSVVVFTADHGEEFNEFGCMFHASHLSLPQLHIPLYLKLGEEFRGNIPDFRRRASQVDIFPTLLHYLTGEDFWSSLFQGESLLSLPKKDYTVGARANASLAPYEFYIQRGTYRAILEFCQREDIFHSRLLKVQSIVNEKEEPIPFSPSFFQNQFGSALDQLFSLH